jgi:hypothetical protein
MAASFMFLASGSPADNTAGAAGFVAGSILIAAGLISVTVLTATEAPPADGGHGPKESGGQRSSAFTDG